MKLFQTISDALVNVRRGKLRTFLTILGLVVGISSVIALVGLGDGSTREVEEQMEALGGDTLSAHLFNQTISYDEVMQINDLSVVAAAAPSKIIRAEISAGRQTTRRGTTEATNENYLNSRNLELESGRNLSSVDLQNRSKVCVIGYDVAQDLFSSTDVVGNTIKLDGDEYVVVGVLQKKGATTGLSPNGLVIIPFTLVNEFGANSTIDTVYARAVDRDSVVNAKQAIIDFLTEEMHFSERSITVNTQDEMLGASNAIDETMTLLLGGIAGISLIVAGIGVMNVMLVSVAERVREIGIKKALGARRRDILLQFLVESLSISLIGGVCGVVAGLLFGLAANSVGMRFEASYTIVLVAAGASLAIGLLFGIFPAYRASRLNPIEALRLD